MSWRFFSFDDHEQTYISIYNSFFHDTRRISVYHVSIPMTSHVRVIHKRRDCKSWVHEPQNELCKVYFIHCQTRNKGAEKPRQFYFLPIFSVSLVNSVCLKWKISCILLTFILQKYAYKTIKTMSAIGVKI